MNKMEVIKTRRHFFKFYFLVVFAFVFLSFIGVVLFRTAFEGFQKGQQGPMDYFLPVFAALSCFMAFYTVYVYRRNSPLITIDPYRKSIDFGSETYSLSEVKKVTLTGKMPFRFVLTFPMEGASILFENGTRRFIYDDMYSNSWQLKKAIDQWVTNEAGFSATGVTPVSRGALRFEKEELFKGNPLTSFRGISLWGMIGFFLALVISMDSPSTGAVIFFLCLSAFWFAMHSWLMHYFGLTRQFFVVRNHNLFWMRKIYRLDDIKEVVFETQGNQPNCLRIITRDFRNKLYPAGTLRDKTWLYLKERLELHGVTVRNECIF